MIALEHLQDLAHGVALQFGKLCEVVIHDVQATDLEKSIVYIENGHISGRHVGDGPSHIVLEARKEDPTDRTGKFAYFTKTKDGRVFRSSTVYIRDDEGHIKYAFCINFDITDYMVIQNGLNRITDSLSNNGSSNSVEKITNNVADLLDDLLEQCEEQVGVPAKMMNKQERLVAIKYLNDAGAFLISKSADKICDYFGISRFTLYSDINTVKGEE